MKTVAFLFGLAATTSLFFAYQQKKRKTLLISKLCADGCWAAHYFFLKAYAGMVPNFVGLIRELVFIKRKEGSILNSPIFPVFFIALNWGLGVFAYRSPISLLPILASTLVTLSLWSKNPKTTKMICLPVSVAFIVYDAFVGSYIGIFNESVGILSILLSLFYKKNNHLGENNMKNSIFSQDKQTDKEPILIPKADIEKTANVITTEVSEESKEKGARFAKEITARFVSDFEKTEETVRQGKAEKKDLMAHVSTFLVVDDFLYVTYYANTKDPAEAPQNQTARFVYCPLNDIQNKTFFDVQAAGDLCSGQVVEMVYDTILMQKDENTLFVLWTARVAGNYYRFYRIFDIPTKTLGEVMVNRFQVGEITNDFSATGIRSALTANGIGYKEMYSDIGIMQKLSTRVENGETYFYSGAYSGDFTCIIKSKDLITWEYVSQPDFPNASKWENATYVLGDKCYYFVRQHDETQYGFLTVYDLNTKQWETPVLIGDCQSRSDFIFYQDKLYLFHAPIDRTHIRIIEINTENIALSKPLLQAKMDTGCFYPFVQYYQNGELAMSYTIDRQHIRLAQFDLKNYL